MFKTVFLAFVILTGQTIPTLKGTEATQADCIKVIKMMETAGPKTNIWYCQQAMESK